MSLQPDVRHSLGVHVKVDYPTESQTVGLRNRGQ